MKKLFRSTLAICLLLCMVLGLTACGKLPMTEENVVGAYQITRVTYTANVANTTGYQSCDYTKKQYEEMAARVEAGTATTKEADNDYYVVGGLFDVVTEFRRDGTIYDLFDNSPDFWLATWKIQNGEFIYTSLPGLDYDQYSAKWKNNKLVLTRTVREHDPEYGVVVYYYEKVSRQEAALTAQSIVGTYRTINAIFTPNADNTQYTTAYAVNRASYEYSESRVNNETGNATDREKYDIFSMVYYTNFTITADGKVLNSGSTQEGLWEIRNGKLIYTATADTINSYSAVWDDGRIVITVNLTYAMGPQGTLVFALEKMPA